MVVEGCTQNSSEHMSLELDDVALPVPSAPPGS